MATSKRQEPKTSANAPATDGAKTARAKRPRAGTAALQEALESTVRVGDGLLTIVGSIRAAEAPGGRYRLCSVDPAVRKVAARAAWRMVRILAEWVAQLETDLAPVRSQLARAREGTVPQFCGSVAASYPAAVLRTAEDFVRSVFSAFAIFRWSRLHEPRRKAVPKLPPIENEHGHTDELVTLVARNAAERNASASRSPMDGLAEHLLEAAASISLDRADTEIYAEEIRRAFPQLDRRRARTQAGSDRASDRKAEDMAIAILVRGSELPTKQVLAAMVGVVPKTLSRRRAPVLDRLYKQYKHQRAMGAGIQRGFVRDGRIEAIDPRLYEPKDG